MSIAIMTNTILNFNENVSFNIKEVRINQESPFFRYHQIDFKNNNNIVSIFFRTSLEDKIIRDLVIPEGFDVNFENAQIRF